jgi:hypothetical protein
MKNPININFLFCKLVLKLWVIFHIRVSQNVTTFVRIPSIGFRLPVQGPHHVES